MVASSPDLDLFGSKVIGRTITDVKKDLVLKVLLKRNLIHLKIISMRKTGLFYKRNLKK
jgi:hypothetical protein